MASLPYPLCHDCTAYLVGVARMPYPPTKDNSELLLIMPTVSYRVGQNHLKSLSNKLDIGLNSLHRISPTTIKPIRTNAEPSIVNPSQTRYSGEHIAPMVISIISDARNVLMPIFQLYYGIVVQWSQTVTGYPESHNVWQVPKESDLSTDSSRLVFCDLC